MTILVTGGAGYIASHVLVELLADDRDLVVLDNLCNSSPASIKRVESITGKAVEFIKGDVRDVGALHKLFSQYEITRVLHFAGLKSVGESVNYPLRYYDNNVSGTRNLVEVMSKAGVFDFVFSSSATVYGNPDKMPITEDFPTGSVTNPYGRSKLMVEEMLRDLVVSDPRWKVALLRYFNPVGAHKSGLIGEDPNGIPNNLLPYITQVAIGKLPGLSIFGGDYPTSDGTGVRDYIHVVDLARGHVVALDYLDQHAGIHTWNLGTGQGYSVLDMVKSFEEVSGTGIPYQIVDRRPGDIAVCYSDPSRAAIELGWKAEKGLAEMMADAWRWQKMNPNGYETASSQTGPRIDEA